MATVTLTCSGCKAVLTLDEAFVGGTCRCQHCGTIQTVPARVRPKQPPKPAKTLYRDHIRDVSGGSGTGLDELANAVASSGLGSGLLHEKSAKAKVLEKPAKPKIIKTQDPSPARPKWLMIVILAGGGLILVLTGGGVATYWLSSRDASPGDTHASSPDGRLGTSVRPSFAGIELEGRSVIYILDRGSATSDVFSDLCAVALGSAASLGPERRFQIIFWSHTGDSDPPLAFPSAGPGYATPQTIAECHESIDAIAAHGQTTPHRALALALGHNPDDIVLATAKGSQLNDAFVQFALAVGKKSPARIHALSIGDESNALKSLAAETNAQYRRISAWQLPSYAR